MAETSKNRADGAPRGFDPARLLPQTLAGQTFLLIVLLLVLAFAAWGRVFNHYYYEPTRANANARTVINVVGVARAALIAAGDPEERRALLARIGPLETIRIYPDSPDNQTRPLPNDRQMRLMMAEIQKHLGEDTRFASSWGSIDGFWISFRLDAHDQAGYWVRLPPEQIERTNVFALLSWGGASLLVAIAGAYLIAARMGRPLRLLAHAARQLGSGQTPTLPTNVGPQEIAVVARAFNQMASDLSRAAADRALLLAGVSHDLRTPLARLRLEIELLDAPGFDNTAMITDIETMDRIIGQFLDYGRGTVQETLQTIDISSLIADIVSPYRLRGIEIRLAAPLNLPLPVYKLSLRRAVTNLIDNALRYAGKDKPLDVDVSVEGDVVCIEVADRGPGIPPGEIARLRQPFTRMEAARTNTRGAGLGLAIVDRIVQAHGGRFDLKQRSGGGLRAILLIPFPAT